MSTYREQAPSANTLRAKQLTKKYTRMVNIVHHKEELANFPTFS